MPPRPEESILVECCQCSVLSGVSDRFHYSHEVAWFSTTEPRGVLFPVWPLEAGMGEGCAGASQRWTHSWACSQVRFSKKTNTWLKTVWSDSSHCSCSILNLIFAYKKIWVTMMNISLIHWAEPETSNTWWVVWSFKCVFSPPGSFLMSIESHSFHQSKPGASQSSASESHMVSLSRWVATIWMIWMWPGLNWLILNSDS